MDTVKKYKKYQKIGRKLNQKIIKKCLSSDWIKKSAKLLGIYKKGGIVIQSEAEEFQFIDFALNDFRLGNKNAIDIYREKIGPKNDIEQEILTALSSSYTSLFKVTSASASENIVTLTDLFNDKEDIKLMNIAFSNSLYTENVLIFSRLLSFDDFTISTGASFAFPPGMEDKLIKEYKKEMGRIKSGSKAIKRFSSFYQLNKKYGIDVVHF